MRVGCYRIFAPQLLESRKPPDVEDPCRAMLICVPLWKCDASVDDDRTVPVPAAGFQYCDLLSGLRPINAESPTRIVDI